MFKRLLSTSARAAQTANTASLSASVPATGAVATTSLLPLKYEHNLYASLKIHNSNYLVTKGDLVNLPFCMHTAQIGDVIQLNNIKTIGSRNFTYHSHKSIDPTLVTISAVVVEKTKKPMTIKEVTKRRNRHTKHTLSKHDLTVLRINELKIN
jgi:large subunit ribosomal protein L21